MMKKILVFFIFLSITQLTNACVCNVPNMFLEFYASKYVFYGEIISKTYPKDSLTYTFTFKIEKHFKDGDQPQTLSFTWPSEPRYRDNVYTSCDYDVNIGNKLLVFANDKNGKLNFGLNCSNSTFNGLSISDVAKLTHANQFNILNYHINFNYILFNDTHPITNIDSLIKPYKNKNYEDIKEGVIIMLDVDTNGNVTKSNFWGTTASQFNNSDSNVSLYDIINKEYRKPVNDFEIDALDIAKSIKKWEVMRFKNGNSPVNSRQYISFSIDKNHNIKWKQFYFMIN
jgi:hypothetical protein